MPSRKNANASSKSGQHFPGEKNSKRLIMHLLTLEKVGNVKLWGKGQCRKSNDIEDCGIYTDFDESCEWGKNC